MRSDEKQRLEQALKLALLLGFTFLHSSRAQEARYFRIAGPVAARITAFSADGFMTWTNAPTNATFTVQTASSLLSPPNWVDYVEVPVTNPVTTRRFFDPDPPAGMALIPAGSFTMGNSIGDSDITNAYPVSVYVSAFYMDVNLVSWSQWKEVCNWATNHGFQIIAYASGKAANHPVQSVLWYGAITWCNARSQLEGKNPVYYADPELTQVYTNWLISTTLSNGVGSVTVVPPHAKWEANGYRLPTEAEWEKAARGGLSQQRFPWGNVISESLANYRGDTVSYNYDLGPNGYNAAFTNGVTPYTSPVGYFGPNGYGLHDMAGNVSQFCWDWYATPYAGGSDPRGPTSGGQLRVLRSTAWGTFASRARCASRSIHSSTNSAVGLWGFRTVMRPCVLLR